MSRRALRKIDTTLSLSRHLLSFDDLPQPWDILELFSREAPLEVEIGSGKGMFLLDASHERPEVNFLGIEIAYKYAEFSAVRLAKRDVPNARVASADAARVMHEILPAGSVAAVHIYFPDPWWKARHKKRRVMNAAFLGHVERTLQPGGTLHFWTDVKEYFDASLDLISKHTRIEGPYDVPERLAEHDLDYHTNFERRVRQSTRPVYRAEFRKP